MCDLDLTDDERALLERVREIHPGAELTRSTDEHRFKTGRVATATWTVTSPMRARGSHYGKPYERGFGTTAREALERVLAAHEQLGTGGNLPARRWRR